MMFATLPATGFAATANAQSGLLDVPSGQAVYLMEYRDESAGLPGIFRARFVAPDLADAAGELDAVFGDIEYLCNAVVLPELTQRALSAARIVVSLSAAPLEFGAIAPDVPQYFESYSVTDDTCIWELH